MDRTRLGVASLPREVNWMVMLDGGCLAGIAFTMSIFIGSLALEGELLDDGKVGTLAGSAIGAIMGCALLLMFMPKRLGTTGTLQSQVTCDDDTTISSNS